MVKKLRLNIFYLILSVLTILALAPLYAEEIPTNITNMLSAEQLENLKKETNQKVGTNNNNLPTSMMPKEQNLRDLETTNKEKLKAKEVVRKHQKKNPLVTK